jgi:hypothetical protein
VHSEEEFNKVKFMVNNAMQRRMYARQRAIAKGK